MATASEGRRLIFHAMGGWVMRRVLALIGVVVFSVLASGCTVAKQNVGEFFILPPFWVFQAEDGHQYLGYFDTYLTKSDRNPNLITLPSGAAGAPKVQFPLFKTTFHDKRSMQLVVGSEPQAVRGRLDGEYTCEFRDQNDIVFNGYIRLVDETNDREYLIKSTALVCGATQNPPKPLTKTIRSLSR
jgi:hypothetical protein